MSFLCGFRKGGQSPFPHLANSTNTWPEFKSAQRGLRAKLATGFEVYDAADSSRGVRCILIAHDRRCTGPVE
jgi:hypothetical protein